MTAFKMDLAEVMNGKGWCGLCVLSMAWAECPDRCLLVLSPCHYCAEKLSWSGSEIDIQQISSFFIWSFSS